MRALGRLGVAATVVVLALLGSAAHAAPIYTASASGACGGQSSTGSTLQLAVVTQILCPPTVWFYGNAAAQAGPGGVGTSADGTSFCCGSYSSFDALALADTEMMIIGPGGSGPIEVSLNLALDAGFSGEVVEGYSDRNLRYTVQMWAQGGYSYLFYGYYREVANGLDGNTFTYSGNIPHQLFGTSLHGIITTEEFLLPVNTLISFDLSLNAWVGNIRNATGAVNAYHTLYFPLDRPVFNLPDGYSAEIYGLNVSDNRVVGASGSVPEPATLGLVTAGLLTLGLTSLRRRRA